MSKSNAVAVVLSCALLTSCVPGPESPKGFSLPLGDKVRGEKVFAKYQCLACHTLADKEDDDLIYELQERVPLGGRVSNIVTYADLVTSIINPSHKISTRLQRDKVAEENKSKMQNFNDVMTVSELVDLVSFLQPKYQLQPYTPTAYQTYYFDNEANKN